MVCSESLHIFYVFSNSVPFSKSNRKFVITLLLLFFFISLTFVYVTREFEEQNGTFNNTHVLASNVGMVGNLTDTFMA